MRGRTAVIVSVGLALLGTLLMFVYLTSRENELLQLGAMKDVIVTTKDLLANTVVDETVVQRIQVPAKYVQPKAVADLRELVGRVVMVPVPKGAQVMGTYLEEAGRTALAYEVPRGKRAVTIGVSAITGVGGLVRPGNFVDILGTFELGRPVANQGGRVQYADERTETAVLMQNVQVIAAGREHRRERPAPQPASESGALFGELGRPAAQTDQQPIVSNVTVLVGMREAQQLVLAQEVGTLTLLLRSNLDAGLTEELGTLDPFKLLNITIPVKPRGVPASIWSEVGRLGPPR